MTGGPLETPAMQLPCLRLTIRSMMVVVAIAALALAGEATRRRMAELSSVYRLRATECEIKALLANLNAVRSDFEFRQGRPPNLNYASRSIRFRRLAEFHLAMRRKYEQAARRPWLHIVLDPAPPPEP